MNRQDIKRDEVRETLEIWFDWIYDHLKTIVWAALVLLAAVVVGVLIWTNQQNKIARANDALADAVRVYEAPVIAPDVVEEPTPDDPTNPSFGSLEARQSKARELFEVVRSEYGSSEAADIAGVYLARLALADGDRATARQLWEGFLTTRRGHALSTAVRLNLWSLERAEGNTEQVAEQIRSRIDSADAQIPQDVLLWELGVTLEEAGQAEEARQAFQRLVDDYPTSPWAQSSRQRLDSPS